MKVLFYNWVDYLDDEKRGGGVSVYQRNLIQEFDADPQVTCHFLCSGISYDLLNSVPRWEQIRHGPSEDRERRFEIINSGVMSPAHHAFGDDRQLDEPATLAALHDFIEANGPYDVVHFNNIEGLPATALNLRDRWPETQVVLSLHNYFPVCPQVNLWFDEKENCIDYDEGRKCVRCLPYRHDQRGIHLANAVAYNLKKRGIRPGTRAFDKAFRPALRLAARALRFYRTRINPSRTDAGAPGGGGKLLKRLEKQHHKFVRHRERMVELINQNCDAVLCVSDRVGEVAARYGVDPALMETCYIGTRHAEKFLETLPRDTILKEDGTLTLAYLGYMRRDKGFFFLLDALEQMPEEMAERIDLVLCSRIVDEETGERIALLSDKFRSVLHADGYTHDQLDTLLQEVDLGVVPPLWEDNLPQVAIEMHARHIPLLTSDLGGAKELGNTPDFVFRAGDVDGFLHRLRLVLEGELDPAVYWDNAQAPRSMAEHVAELRAHYGFESTGPVPAAQVDVAAAAAAETAATDDPIRAEADSGGEADALEVRNH